MTVIKTSIDVDVPVRTAYNQFTQFEEFPRFMEGVDRIQQLDDKNLHWVTSIAGARREFDTEITEQIPDQRIAWRATAGELHSGTVTFEPHDENRCRVTVEMEYDPKDVIEKVGDTLGFVTRRVYDDLERFKRFVEQRGRETGAWRGEIQESA
jgi:uncharacterized membrane protein